MPGAAVRRLVADQLADLAIGKGDHVRVGAGQREQAPQLGGAVHDAFDNGHIGGRVVGPVPADLDVPARSPLHARRLIEHTFQQV